MDKQKKDIIINEIQYWKETKLLPETYCQFLLALYTEGNLEIDKQENEKKAKGSFVLLGILICLLMTTLLVTYFTELSFVLQTVTEGILLGTSVFVTAYLIRKKIAYQLPLILTFVQLLITSVNLVEVVASENRFWFAVTIVGNCLLWIVIGRRYRIHYLFISGLLAIFVFILTIIL